MNPAVSFAEQLQYSAQNRHLAGQSLSKCVTLAQSIGQLAEQGRKYQLPLNVIDKFVGAVQVGEYILTGFIPDKETVESVIETQEAA